MLNDNARLQQVLLNGLADVAVAVGPAKIEQGGLLLRLLPPLLDKLGEEHAGVRDAAQRALTTVAHTCNHESVPRNAPASVPLVGTMRSTDSGGGFGRWGTWWWRTWTT